VGAATNRPEVVTITGVAELLGVSRQWADVLSRGKDFPDPLPMGAGSERTRVWLAADITAYKARRDQQPR